MALVNRYWVPAGTDGTGNWDGSDTTHWSATSGGAGGASVPDWESLVKFDANSFSDVGQTVTITASAPIHSIDCLGVTNTPTFAGNPLFPLYGTTARFVADMVFSSAPSVTFYPYADYSNLTCNLTTGGHEFALIEVLCGTAEGDDGCLYLQDDANVVSNGYFHIQYGSLDTNDHTINCGIFYGEFYRSLNLGASTINCLYASGGALALKAGNDWAPEIGTITQSGKFVVPGGSITIYNAYDPPTEVVTIGNLEWGSLDYVGQTFQFNGDMILGDLKLSKDIVYQFIPDGCTVTLDTLTGNGASGEEIVIQGETGSDYFEFIKATGVISVDYYDIANSIASGGATFYAGANSIDSDGNTGWLFEAPPVEGFNIFYGTTQVIAIYLGEVDVTSVYLGATPI